MDRFAFFPKKLDSETRKLETLYHLYKKDMFSLAMQILHNHHDAQDIVQTAIMKIHKHIDLIDDVTSIKARSFIRTITKHTALDLYRRKKKTPTLQYSDILNEKMESDELTVEDLAVRICDAGWLASKLANINIIYAEIIMMKYYHDLSDDEIAHLLCISETNVRVRLHRAKKALKKIIESEEDVI